MDYFQGIDSLQVRVENALMKSETHLTNVRNDATVLKEIIAPNLGNKVKKTTDHVGKAEKRLSETSQV